jgi:hypothetical protein
MAGNAKVTSNKRARERAKALKRQEKEQRREARKKAKEAELPPQGTDSDPDLAGMKPGPQPPPY